MMPYSLVELIQIKISAVRKFRQYGRSRNFIGKRKMSNSFAIVDVELICFEIPAVRSKRKKVIEIGHVN